MKLQQELKGKEAHLEQCYLRMERGEPPNEEIEVEWQKTLRQELQRRKEMEQRKAVCLLNFSSIESKCILFLLCFCSKSEVESNRNQILNFRRTFPSMEQWV